VYISIRSLFDCHSCWFLRSSFCLAALIAARVKKVEYLDRRRRLERSLVRVSLSSNVFDHLLPCHQSRYALFMSSIIAHLTWWRVAAALLGILITFAAARDAAKLDDKLTSLRSVRRFDELLHLDSFCAFRKGFAPSI
jgi:hypothetical protein